MDSDAFVWCVIGGFCMLWVLLRLLAQSSGGVRVKPPPADDEPRPPPPLPSGGRGSRRWTRVHVSRNGETQTVETDQTLGEMIDEMRAPVGNELLADAERRLAAIEQEMDAMPQIPDAFNPDAFRQYQRQMREHIQRIVRAGHAPPPTPARPHTPPQPIPPRQPDPTPLAPPPGPPQEEHRRIEL